MGRNRKVVKFTDNRGISSLGLLHKKYDITRFIKAFKKCEVMRFGWLDGFFNRSKGAMRLERLMRLPKKKIVRVHIINGPGLNNGRPQRHEISYGYTHASLVKAIIAGNPKFINKFIKRCQLLNVTASLAKPGSLELYISPWLEHGPMPKECFDKLAYLVKKHIPLAKDIVDNPRGPNATFFKGYLKEEHGAHAAKNIDIADLDGEDYEGVDLLAYAKRYHKAKMCLVWGYGDNGLEKGKAWKGPYKRTKFTSEREFKTYERFLEADLSPKEKVTDEEKRGYKIKRARDGRKKNFVWKQGEGKPGATALFPSSFSTRFFDVQIKKNGECVAQGTFREKYTDDGSNRLIYDFPIHTADLPDGCLLVADAFAWIINKPAFRMD